MFQNVTVVPIIEKKRKEAVNNYETCLLTDDKKLTNLPSCWASCAH